MISNTIPSYLYDEYSDDVTLQAFVSAYNTMTQQYVDWFVNANLPVYTGLSSQLLDWVGLGLYGVARPTLQPGLTSWIGEFNTVAFNTGLAYNSLQKPLATLANDDIYQRVITWQYYKGDGQVFNFDWLKRRIIRFLYGINGNDVEIASLWGIDITVITNAITININTAQLYNSKINSLGLITYGVGFYNIQSASLGNPAIASSAIGSDYQAPETTVSTVPLDPSVLVAANIFKNSIATPVLPLPFQFTYAVNII